MNEEKRQHNSEATYKRCKWERDDFCVNADCEHCADFCVTDYKGNFPCEHFEEAD